MIDRPSASDAARGEPFRPMRSDAPTVPRLPRPPRAAIILAAVAALAGPTEALGAPTPTPSRQAPTAVGTLTQLRGPTGCLVDGSEPSGGCTPAAPCAARRRSSARSAVAISPDGQERLRRLVAQQRDRGLPAQRADRQADAGGGHAPAASPSSGASGCATARGLDGPNSVAVSPDGTQRLRDVARAATPSPSSAATASTGALTQATSGGCIAGAAIPGCAAGPRARRPGRRHGQPRRRERLRRRVLRQRGRGRSPATPSTGALTQPAGRDRLHRRARRPTAAPPASRSALPRAWRSAATATTSTSRAALSNAVGVLTRDPSTGALTQATDGSGCIADTPARRLHDRHRSSPARTPSRSAPTTATSTSRRC